MTDKNLHEDKPVDDGAATTSRELVVVPQKEKSTNAFDGLPQVPSMFETDGDPFAVELPGSQNYGICLFMCVQALANDKYHDALVLARQAEMVGAITDGKTRLPRVTNAYARITIASAIDARSQAMTTGEVTANEVDLLDTAVGASKNLLNRLSQHGKEIPVSLARTVLSKLTEAKTLAAEPRKRTTAEVLESYLAALKVAIELASRLDITGGEANLSISERAEICSKSVDTAEGLLRYWFSKRRSDWRRAEILCKYAADILSPKPNVMEAPVAETPEKLQIADGLLIPSTGTEVASAIAMFGQLGQALSGRDYSQSVALIKSTRAAIAEIE